MLHKYSLLALVGLVIGWPANIYASDRFLLGKERCEAYYREASAALKNVARDAAISQETAELLWAQRCAIRFDRKARAKGDKDSCPKAYLDLNKAFKCILRQCKETANEPLACAIKRLVKARDKDFFLFTTASFAELQVLINNLEILLKEKREKERDKKKKKKKKSGNVCKKEGGTTNITVANNTDTTLRASRLHRTDPLDPNTETTELLGDVAPTSTHTFSVPSKYGTNRLLLSPYCRGQEMRLSDPSINLGDLQLVESVPEKEPCITDKSFQIFDNNFVSTVLVCGDFQPGEDIEVICPDSLIQPDGKTATYDRKEIDTLGDPMLGIARQSCFYTHNPTPGSTLTRPHIMFHYSPEATYFDRTGSTIGCQPSSFTTSQYNSPTRQFRIELLNIETSLLQSLAPQLLASYQNLGASCP